MAQTMERWKPVVGFEGRYEISVCGRVRRVVGGRGAVAGRILKPKWSQSRWFVSLGTSRTDRKNFYVHTLVLEAFVGPCPTGMEGCHGDDNPNHNQLSNLRWDTKAANQHDRIHNGIGNNTRLTPYAIRIMRRLFDLLSNSEIAQTWGITENYVSRIKCGSRWGWV